MNPERVFQILMGPHMSEKAAMAAENGNQYVFKVALDATKVEIKASVEQLFSVRVDNVTTLRVKGKKMAGHMGAERVTTQGLEVVRVDSERNLLLIKGAVPGAPGGHVIVRPTVKG